ncbi:hypothetical protein ACHAXN_011873 [Cyclotella atomus]
MWDTDQPNQVETCGHEIEEAMSYVTDEANGMLTADGLCKDDGIYPMAFHAMNMLVRPSRNAMHQESRLYARLSFNVVVSTKKLTSNWLRLMKLWRKQMAQDYFPLLPMLFPVQMVAAPLWILRLFGVPLGITVMRTRTTMT